ncbi:adenylate/guanylate cyclase domain-containing protein [Jannaschia seosinensis]|nr:adenylate/guanylate cyclase domain-containing protein [Jannaschia seosinensis]
MELPKVLSQATFAGRDIPVGMAMHTGRAYLSTVVSVTDDMQEVSAFGFDVNVAARLAAAAEPGEVLISEAAMRAADREIDNAALRSFELKGVDEQVRAASLHRS